MYFNRNPYGEWHSEIDRLSWNKDYPFNDWFEGNKRVFLPFDPKGSLTEEDEEIIDVLEEEGFEVHDFKGGYCRRPGSRSIQRIGKVLNSIKKKDIAELHKKHQQGELYNLRREILELEKYFSQLFEQFSSSAYRTAKNITEFYVVISQDPHDIAKMSTDRRWESCMTLGSGQHYKSVLEEVKDGGFIAYLIRAEDKGIDDPLCRVHIRHFEGVRGPAEGYSVAKPEESVYGEEVPGFDVAVQGWIDDYQGEIPAGLYRLRGGHYSDTFSETHFFGGKWDLSEDPQELLDIYQGIGLEDIPYKVWEVRMEETVAWRIYADEDENTSTFYSLEEAENFVFNQDLTHYSDWRVDEDEQSDAYWTLTDSETGDYLHEPFEIVEIIVDKRPELQAKAAAKMVLQEPETYSIEIVKEIKEKYPSLRNQLIQRYPELFIDETKGFSKYDLIRFIESLPENQRGPHVQQLEQTFHEMVESPSAFLPPCYICEAPIDPSMEEMILCPTIGMRHHAACPEAHEQLLLVDQKRNRSSNEYGHSDYSYKYMDLQDIMDQYCKFHKGPIPEHLIQKLIEVPEKTYFSDTDRLRIHSHILHILSMSGSDTPTVQEYYEHLLPHWHFEIDLWQGPPNSFMEHRRSGETIFDINNLGSAIARLGINGQRFLPFIKDRLAKLENIFGPQIFDPNQVEPPPIFRPVGRIREWEMILRLTERYLYILDSIESGQGFSRKYRFSW